MTLKPSMSQCLLNPHEKLTADTLMHLHKQHEGCFTQTNVKAPHTGTDKTASDKLKMADGSDIIK